MFNTTYVPIAEFKYSCLQKHINILFGIGTLFINNNLNEFCGTLDKLFDFEFWDRGFDPITRGDSFVLYLIKIVDFIFLYVGVIYINR